MLIALIAACEVGFWVILGLGLLVRYVVRWPRVSAALLLGVPLVDLTLLIATALDLRRGAEPNGAHALAAVYLGVTVAWGHQVIAWADRWAAHRFDGAPRPTPPAKTGRAHAARERRGWLRHLLAWALGSALLLAGSAYVGMDRSGALLGVIGTWSMILVIDFFISFSYTVSPRPEKSSDRVLQER